MSLAGVQRRSRRIAGIFILVALVRSGPGDLSAQVTGAQVETGGQGLAGQVGSSRLQEYRDLSPGSNVSRFFLDLATDENRSTLSLWGTDVSRSDQVAGLRLRSGNTFRTQVSWDQIPHQYTQTARTIFSGAGSGALEIPRDVRVRLRSIISTDVDPHTRGLQFDTGAVVHLINGMARGAEVASDRDRFKGAAKYSPLSDVDVMVDYSNERRSGTKPLGSVLFYHVPTELIEPTSYRTQEASARIEYASKAANIQFGYWFSHFSNRVDVLVWDNPFRESDVFGAPSRAGMDLYPDNSAHRLSLSGGITLPFSTRITSNCSYGVRLQNDRFMPSTINTAIETMRTAPALPAAGLDGRLQNLLLSAELTNRALTAVWLTARCRIYDYDNRTRSLLFPGYVDQDALITPVQRQTLLVGYRKRNLSVQASVHPVRSVSANFGYEREGWVRRYGEAGRTDENIYKASLDYTPSYRIRLWSSYSFSSREPSEYNAKALETELYPAGRQAGILGQLPGLQNYVLAGLDRNRGTISLRFIPLSPVTLTAGAGFVNDEFKQSEYGVMHRKSGNFSLDASFSPNSELMLAAWYTGEYYSSAMKSRQRVFGNDTSINDWQSDCRDDVHTFGASLVWSVVPEEVDFSADFSLSDAIGTLNFDALGDPADRKFLVKTAQDFPPTRHIVRHVRASVLYHMTEHFKPRLEYRFEGYSESSFAEDVVEPYMIRADPAEVSALYLGLHQPGYAAHIVAIALSYIF